MQKDKPLNGISNTIIWSGAAAVTMLLGLAIGIIVGNSLLNSTDKSRVSQNTDTIKQLQQELLSSESALETLEIELAVAREGISSTTVSPATAEALKEITALKDELSQLQSHAVPENNAGDATDMANSIENHRVLLVEMRKDKPIDRENAYEYWKSIKSVASLADPSLSSPVDKVILGIDNYFDWQERGPSQASQPEEYVDWLNGYDTSGAVSYELAIVRFNKDALLSLITELDLIGDSLK